VATRFGAAPDLVLDLLLLASSLLPVQQQQRGGRQ